MPNGVSRRKGLRGEQDIRKRLGGKRVGVAYMQNPVDVETDFACYQVKNRPMGGAAILTALRGMEAVAPGRNLYLTFKAGRGVWLVVETLEQHQAHHGEPNLKK